MLRKCIRCFYHAFSHVRGCCNRTHSKTCFNVKFLSYHQNYQPILPLVINRQVHGGTEMLLRCLFLRLIKHVSFHKKETYFDLYLICVVSSQGNHFFRRTSVPKVVSAAVCVLCRIDALVTMKLSRCSCSRRSLRRSRRQLTQ